MGEPAPSEHDAADTVEIGVQGMTCAACVRRIDKALRAVPGVREAQVNLVTHRATVVVDPAAAPIEGIEADIWAAVERAGYEPVRLTPPPATLAAVDASELASGNALAEAEDREQRELRRDFAVAAAFTAPLLAVAMSHGLMAWTTTTFGRWLQLALAAPVVLGPGRRFFRLAGKALVHRASDMNTLVALGTGAAFAYSTTALVAPSLFQHAEHGMLPHLYFEAAGAIITFLLFGKMLEARARKRLVDAVRGLASLQPRTAHRMHERSDVEEDVPIAALCRGDRVRVRPGERIPADGVVVGGVSAVDEAMLTGESLPVDKTETSKVYGGTLNQSGTLVIEVSAVGKGSALARIIDAVEQAPGSRAPIARLADTVSGVFVPVVLALALLTLVAWCFVDSSAGGVAIAIERFVAVLVIACPCALGLATPAAVAVGIGRGAELGILVKGGAALEAASRVTRVLLDKTGTLTRGRPELVAIVSADAGADAPLLTTLASAERPSEHPVARAVVEAALARGLTLGKADAFQSFGGRGIAATVRGRVVRAGTAAWLQSLGVDTRALEAEADRLAARGATPLFVAEELRLAGVVAVADQPAPEARAALAELAALGIRVTMLTGDRAATARAIASELGIEEVVAEVRPEEKARFVTEARAGGDVVAMVGDGINDAPALAAAHVGVAIGHGAEIAVAASDVALLRGGIKALPTALRLGRATLRTIRQNLFWAFVYNVIGIPVAAGLLYPWTGWQLSPVIASAAMSLSSVSVLTSSLRLRRFERVSPVREGSAPFG